MDTYYPKNSQLHNTDAFVKLLCFLILITSVILTDSFLGYILLASFTILIIFLSKIDIKSAFSPILHLWLFFIVIFFMNALFFETERPLWSFWIFNLSISGIVQGTNIILRVIFIMVLSSIFTFTTPPISITNAIKNLLFPLKFLCVPVSDIAMILSAAIQFIPTFINEADMIKKAQTARGARFESKHLLDKAKSFFPLIIPIFLSAFKRADELALAMEARGYRKARGNLAYPKVSFDLKGFFALLVSLIICTAQILL